MFVPNPFLACFENGVCGGIRTPNGFLGLPGYSRVQPTVSASHTKKWRRGRESNAQYLSVTAAFKATWLAHAKPLQTWR